MRFQDGSEEGFVPGRWRDPDGRLEWIEASGEDFSEPFAAQTLKRLEASGRRVRTTHWTSLLASTPTMEIAGFIFHMARCGSTWACQGLRTLDRALVFSEPPALEAAWIAGGPEPGVIDPVLHRAMIQGALSALGRAGRRPSCDVFVKPTSWAIESADLLLKAAPRARSVFLFRHPVEVLVSILEATPSGLRDGEPLSLRTRRLGLPLLSAAPEDRREISALITQRAMTQALAHRARLRFVSYESLLTSGLEPLLRFFRPTLSEDESRRARLASSRYSKDPTRLRAFSGDGEGKRARADARVRELYETLLRDPYEECLALSRSASGGIAA